MADTPSEKTKTHEYADERDMDRFWEVARLAREPFKQRWYLPGLIFFIVLSIPWYREAGQMGRIVGGLPVWVWTTLGCCIGVATLTATAALRFWRDDEDEDD